MVLVLGGFGPAQAQTGTTVAGGNGQGPAVNQLNFPSGIFVDGVGTVYVADTGNDVNSQEAVGKAAQEVFPSLEPGWVDTYQQSLDSGQTIRVEQFVPGLDRWFEVTAFFDGNDQFVAHYEDITARRQTQKSQQHSTRLQLALDVAQLGTQRWNLLTNEGYLDSRGAELIGKATGYQPNVAQAQIASIHPDQSVHHIRSRFYVVADLTGRPVKLMRTNLDVTAEYELTTALRQSQEKQAFC
ncbi:hypothetical protein GCM10028825_48850 [Spirosoma agri]